MFDSRKVSLYQQRMSTFVNSVDVYPVSCEQLANNRSDKEWLDQVLEGGARIVQLRDKVSGDRELLEKALYFRRKTKEAGALFMVNDRVDIALLAEADGIHVGQDDMDPERIRKIAPDLIIGLSCNTVDQVKELGSMVAKGSSAVSYYNIGPIYQTGTKAGLKKFLGPEAIGEFSSHCSLPFTVMGGIKELHIDELLEHGARRLAVVTALSQADDIAAETRKWQRKIAETKQKIDGA